MAKRREVRHSLTFSVRIWGMDVTGQMFEQYATAVDVTTSGARIADIEHLVQRGCVIGVEHGSSRARYRVAWVGMTEVGRPGEVGLQLIEKGKFIWGRVIPREFGDSFPNQMAFAQDQNLPDTPQRNPSHNLHRQVEEKQKRIEFLEKKVQTKDEVLAELMAEHVALKKTLG
jgi:hypothetical protein